MMCKVVKKGLIGMAIGAGALGLLYGTSAPSYVKTAFFKVRERAQRSVPIEFEIDKARQEIAQLEPAINSGIEALVKAEVEAEHLDKEIVATREELNREGRELQALNDHLKTGDLHLTNGVAYTAKEVKTDLARRMDHYRLVKNILAEKQETLKVRQKNVLAARENLVAMQAAKRDLMARVEGIEARLNQIRASRATNDFTFDDTAVGKAKQTVSELETKLEEMVKIDDYKGRYADRGVSVTVEPGRDVAKEIDAEFGTSPKASEKVGEKY